MKITANRSLGAALLMTFFLAGAAQAQTEERPDPGMLPDHPLYFLTSLSEGVGTLFTFGDRAEAERAVKLSGKRLAEADALAAREKPEEARKAVERYREQLDRALARATEARADGKDTDEVLGDVSEATLRHQTVLARVYENVPEQARPGIERAMQASMRGHKEAMKGMSGRKRGEVMRNRANRGGRDVESRHEELRARGVPVPVIPTREEIEREAPDGPETGRPGATPGQSEAGNPGEASGRPQAPGRTGPREREERTDTTEGQQPSDLR